MLKIFYGHAARNLGDVAITYGVYGMLQQAGYKGDYRFYFPETTSAPAISAREAIMSDLGAQRCEVLDLDALESAVRDSGLEAEDYASRIDELAGIARRALTGTTAGGKGVALFNACEHLFSYASRPRPEALLARILPMYLNDGRRASLPATFGPFEDEPSLAIMRRFFQDLSHVAGREAESASLVSRLAPEKAEQAANGLLDPAFFLPHLQVARHPEPLRKTIVLVPRLDGFGLRVGVEESRQRSSAYREDGFESSLAFRAYLSVARELVARKARLVLLVQTCSDSGLCRALRGAIRSEFPGASVSIVVAESFAHWVNILNGATAVYTSRFHSAILALALAKPIVGVYFDEHGGKLPGLFKQFAIDDRAFLYGPEASSSLAERIADKLLVAREGPIQAQLTEVRRLLARRTIDYLCELLEP